MRSKSDLHEFRTNPGLSVKCLMIISERQIWSFFMTRNKVNAEMVLRFLKRSFVYIRSQLKLTETPLLILDNAPKNRNTRILKLALNNLFILLYIVPATPQ